MKGKPLIFIIRTKYLYLYVIINFVDTKLTLKLRAEVISRAKLYAKKRKISLSRIIESYLDSISGEEEGDLTTTPLIERLSGVVDLPESYDYKKERAEDLERKHL
jgi:hypothetical protein